MASWPLQIRDIPNLITSLRILLVPPFLWLLLQGRYGAALLLFTIAGFSDALDGFLAKRYGWTSDLGGILDPIADKLLLVGAILVLGWLGALPLWLVALAILRDAIIVAGAISYHLMIERIRPNPLFISKFNTLLQLGLVFVVIVHRGLLPLPDGLLAGLFYLTAVTTIWSGIAYVWRWGWAAWRTVQDTSPPCE